MKTLARCISAEILKTRRTVYLLGVIAMPTILSLFNFLLLSGLNEREGYYADKGWVHFEHNTITFWSMIVFPCVIVLLSAFAAHQEHDTKSWRRLMCLPLPKAPLYLAKLALVMGLGFFSCLLLWVENILWGALYAVLRPEMGLSLANMRPWEMLVPFLFIYLLSLLVVGLHFWFSMRFQNFVLSIGIGFVLCLVGAFLHDDPLWKLVFPWSLPSLVHAAENMTEGIAGLLYSLGGFTLIVLAGCRRFIRWEVLTFTILLLLTGCQSKPDISPANTKGSTPDATAPHPAFSQHYDPTDNNPFQIDLRSQDLSMYDMRQAANDLSFSNFSTRTNWPEEQWLPEGFDPQAILNLGKDPGLGVRSLHQQGITGKGVSVAIIDQPLMIDHIEYAGRLKLYEKEGILFFQDTPSMHGPAVASIAVGETIGVAPEANLYFIAAGMSATKKDGQQLRDFTHFARSVRRIVEINRTLPAEEKIRVLSLSIGWGEMEPGYAEMVAAVEEAKQEGIFVVSSSLETTYPGYKFHGLGRDPLGNPNENTSYTAGQFWASQLNDPKTIAFAQDRIMIPMDSRTYASYLGKEDYNWGRSGGWSWSIPYIAGLYALAVQVNPEVTAETFWQAVVETAQPFTVEVDGQETALGKIIQPVPLIEALKK